MNRCLNCQTLLSDAELAERREHDPYCTGDSPDEIVYSCPHCRSEDIELDVILCDTCGEQEPYEGCDDCLQCIQEGKIYHAKIIDLCECPYCGEIELDVEAGECRNCHNIVNFAA